MICVVGVVHEIAGFKMSLLIRSIHVKDSFLVLCNFPVWCCLFELNLMRKRWNIQIINLLVYAAHQELMQKI